MTTSEIPTVRAPSQEAPDEDQVELLAELGNEVHCLVPLLLSPGKQQLRLGRSPGSDIYLPDPSVSGEHAELTVEDGGVRIFDRQSKNGTYLNGQRLEGVHAPWLQPMDRLSFGRVRAFACEPRTLRAVVRQDLRAMF